MINGSKTKFLSRNAEQNYLFAWSFLREISNVAHFASLPKLINRDWCMGNEWKQQAAAAHLLHELQHKIKKSFFAPHFMKRIISPSENSSITTRQYILLWTAANERSLKIRPEEFLAIRNDGAYKITSKRIFAPKTTTISSVMRRWSAPSLQSTTLLQVEIPCCRLLCVTALNFNREWGKKLMLNRCETHKSM